MNHPRRSATRFARRLAAGALCVGIASAASFAAGGSRAARPAAAPPRAEIVAAVHALVSPQRETQLEGLSTLSRDRAALRVRELEAGIRSSSVDARRACAFLLGFSTDPDAERAVVTMALDDADPGVQSVALESVHRLREEETYKPFLRAA